MNMIERVKERPVAPCIIEDVSQLHLLETFGSLKTREVPTEILMCRPTHYRVEYVINVHMTGNIGRVDRGLAMRQWVQLHDALQSVSTVHLMDGVDRYPDMVFTANAGLPFHDADRKFCVMSKMRDHQRQGEVRHYAKFLSRLGYEIDYLECDEPLEGEGDVLWHPKWRLLLAGWGQRSSRKAYEELSVRYRVPIILLELVDPRFYHLDTALLPLSVKNALCYPKAFSQQGSALIEAVFSRVKCVSETEALAYACNSVRIDQNVEMPSDAPEAAKHMADLGFQVHTTPMSEYLKGGGAAKCLSLLVQFRHTRR